MLSTVSTPLLSPTPRVANFKFATEVGCPFCAWSTAASSPSYCLAQTRVVEGLLAHVDTVHAEPARQVA